MASLSRDANGTKRITFTDGDGKRRTIRLGAVSVRAAETFRLRVEALAEARTLGTAIAGEAAAWVAALPDAMHARLARVGLVPPRASERPIALGELLEGYEASLDVKPSSLIRTRQAMDSLRAHFGEDALVKDIDEDGAVAWRAGLKAAGYAPATIARTVRYARAIWTWAMRRLPIDRNPFAELDAGPQTNPARQAFVDRPTIERVLEAAPDAHWRLLIALSRFGGLRVPSEAFALRWSDIDWASDRMTVRSSKTERHADGGVRTVPIFVELRPYLLEAFALAEEGEDRVLPTFRPGYNPTTQFARIIRRAGVKPWPRIWHALRGSRQTELAGEYPLATACAWIGNSRMVAAGHYLQTTDADWIRATGGGAQSGAPTAQKASQRPSAPNCARERRSAGTPCESSVSASPRSSAHSGAESLNGPYRT